MSESAKDLLEKRRAMMVRLLDPTVADNPLVFVKTAWRWGQPGSFLVDHKEPRKWQCEELERLGDWVQSQLRAKREGRPGKMYRRAFCSGHGTGKGAFWSMVKHWFKSTRLGSSIIDTANTDDQLITRTWAESEKWFEASVNADWFDFKRAALLCTPADWLQDELRLSHVPLGHYFDKGQMYTRGKPDSWAGLHNPRGVMLGIDEASGVPDFISTTSQGFFAGEGLWHIWFQFSQGRHTTGYFYDLQDDPKWELRHLNALEIEGTDKEFLQGIVDKEGPNSYDARVLVFGLYPDARKEQFIKNSAVETAMKRLWTPEHERAARYEQIIMACDPSGGGDDADLTVIGKRRGFDLRTMPFIEIRGMEIPALIQEIVREYKRTNPRPAAIVIDCTGLGLGVFQGVRKLLRKNRSVTVIGVNFGESAESKAWKDKRTELYARTRDWLADGFLPNNKDLKRDLTAPATIRLDGGKTKLESKRALKSRGLPSPDRGDVVALTMEPTLVPLDPDTDHDRDRSRRAKNTDYDAINGAGRRAA